ncbi:IS4 family transposase [Candidatus Sulfidibacterium hydrothermale]|uniref:IS4 family transposase n=1 Tax=Candidatus Sulfidibacterium hydrothermale TaxID=2875962 RepID=UPI001F0A2DAE|nr:IS4 family transposase [Candidatus Sulfidibacterium hydrothermale]UBM61385.1 IS4 family transposase [Candidatus Sulfidibacterium hydrothermale]UBM61521.1 IS4 family transposase [Candidatus Sulfidibacterium hydrothermale]UBM61601.1 IS4 family transposase [Candidatus Sulfidibacterium hydrothermale]UBM62289.1 IS4 family transposase [Candidatus Sulfidibacterium hydrothermale]UBM63258.1 IS4 family transposase [Candidatus Sulfidibacterium hydrothermale]
MKNTNVSSKDSHLVSVLKEHFEGRLNLARIKFISLFIIALTKVRTVHFESLARGFDTQAEESSSLRRIQRFISSYSLDSDLIAKLIFSLLPHKERLTLSIDRTNWKFGKTDINIFMLGIVYQGVAFPLLFSMLKKRGNSNSQERINLIERYINLFGKGTIECIVADREFVGEKWLKYLNNNNLHYYIRIRNNFKVFVPRKNKTIKAFWLFNAFRINEFVYYPNIVEVNGQLCYLSGSKLHNGEYLILVSFTKPEKADDYYKQRWQIEMTFKAMKSSGFDIEKTHLSDIKRIEKLVLLIMVAFVWVYKVGIHIHQNIKPIKIKKHGRKAKTIFKTGLDFITKCFLNDSYTPEFNIFQFLSCT